MTAIELPDDVAAALKSVASARGLSVSELVAQFVAMSPADEIDSFIGVGASGRSAPLDIAAERAAEASRRAADNI